MPCYYALLPAPEEIGQKDFGMNDSRSFQISSDQVPDAPEAMRNNKVIA
jgi:hypothetical protein